MKGALIVLVLCVVTRLDTSVADVFSMIGDEIYKQLDNAWNIVKEFVKRPVRVKKLSENDKKVHNSIKAEPPEDLANEIETIPETKISRQESIPSFLYYFHRKQRKLILPIIKGPVWQTRQGWYQAQRPDLGYRRRRDEFYQKANLEGDNMNTVLVNYGDKTTTNQIYSELEDEDIGEMIFI